MILNYKNKIIGSITIGILGIIFSFFIIGYNTTANAQQPQQQNMTSITINNTLGEDFKDCFLDIKTKSGLTGMNVNKWIMTLCYEPYKGEGAFNHQLSALKAYIKDSRGEWTFEMSFVSLSSIWNEVNLYNILLGA